MAKKKVTEAPDYRNKSRSFSVTVYDIQGDPISTDLYDKVVTFIENSIKESGVKSLGYSVELG